MENDENDVKLSDSSIEEEIDHFYNNSNNNNINTITNIHTMIYDSIKDEPISSERFTLNSKNGTPFEWKRNREMMAVWNLSLPNGSKVQIDDNVFHITHKNRKQEKEGTHILKGEIFGVNGQQLQKCEQCKQTDEKEVRDRWEDGERPKPLLDDLYMNPNFMLISASKRTLSESKIYFKLKLMCSHQKHQTPWAVRLYIVRADNGIVVEEIKFKVHKMYASGEGSKRGSKKIVQ